MNWFKKAQFASLEIQSYDPKTKTLVIQFGSNRTCTYHKVETTSVIKLKQMLHSKNYMGAQAFLSHIGR